MDDQALLLEREVLQRVLLGRTLPLQIPCALSHLKLLASKMHVCVTLQAMSLNQ